MVKFVFFANNCVQNCRSLNVSKYDYGRRTDSFKDRWRSKVVGWCQNEMDYRLRNLCYWSWKYTKCPALAEIYALVSEVTKNDLIVDVVLSQLTLDVRWFPAPVNSEYYICQFGSSVRSSRATYDADKLYCPAVVPDRSVFAGQGMRRTNITLLMQVYSWITKLDYKQTEDYRM